MDRLARVVFAPVVLSALLACAGTPRTSDVVPLSALSGIDSVSVLVHVEHPCAGISREALENEVISALRDAGVGISSDRPPYLHVRAYARAGVPTISDSNIQIDLPASWHVGMWIDHSRNYPADWGPLSNPCPGGPALWAKGGSGIVAEGKLLRFVQTSLRELAEEYHAANSG